MELSTERLPIIKVTDPSNTLQCKKVMLHPIVFESHKRDYGVKDHMISDWSFITPIIRSTLVIA